MITRMTSALYTKDNLRSWYRDDGREDTQLWELESVSDIANTIFVLENHGEVWKQEWKFHVDNQHTLNVDKEKFCEYTRLTVSEG